MQLNESGDVNVFDEKSFLSYNLCLNRYPHNAFDWDVIFSSLCVRLQNLIGKAVA